MAAADCLNSTATDSPQIRYYLPVLLISSKYCEICTIKTIRCPGSSLEPAAAGPSGPVAAIGRPGSSLELQVR